MINAGPAPQRGSLIPAPICWSRHIPPPLEKIQLCCGMCICANIPASWIKWREETPGRFSYFRWKSLALLHEPQAAEGGPASRSRVSQLKASPSCATASDRSTWQLPGNEEVRRRGRSQLSSKLLPREKPAGVPLRHAIEVRHESFKDARFPRSRAPPQRGPSFLPTATTIPPIDEPTADYYARLMRTREEVATGYRPPAWPLAQPRPQLGCARRRLRVFHLGRQAARTGGCAGG